MVALLYSIFPFFCTAAASVPKSNILHKSQSCVDEWVLISMWESLLIQCGANTIYSAQHTHTHTRTQLYLTVQRKAKNGMNENIERTHIVRGKKVSRNQVSNERTPHQNHALGFGFKASRTTPAAYWSGVMVSIIFEFLFSNDDSRMMGLGAIPGTLCTWAWKAASMGWKMESESGSVYHDQGLGFSFSEMQRCSPTGSFLS